MIGDLAAFREQIFLGSAAMLPQAMELDRVEFFGQTLRDVMRERGVDIIATQQNVIPHRNPFERDFAGLVLHGNQSEIRGAAADVDHQNQIADAHEIAPIGVTLDPRVEGRLWLLQ